ncbi:hypothetical protein DN069_38685 [Streptacidiphilus pinicola]|uniref:Uncharacterized protein n=1 Tax=Streptacidiphilus pinicola TaxID=2219663 RepID=A0A2X0JYQ3_9ACTN|nr:hypothetical protein [Streptacidiphilus pinicola]RAG80329.1 hypothetical protein DN069_38685 [Streptacidiphilus pinicola]
MYSPALSPSPVARPQGAPTTPIRRRPGIGIDPRLREPGRRRIGVARTAPSSCAGPHLRGVLRGGLGARSGAVGTR